MQVAKKCFKDEWEEKRVEFLPVEWRTWLTLDKGRSYHFILYIVQPINSAFDFIHGYHQL